jgi:glutamate-1-semialdehyde 2,1-aminomutase
MAAGYAGLSQIYTPDVARDFNAMGDALRVKLQTLSQGTKMTVMGRGSLVGIHFLEDGNKDVKSYRDRKDEDELKDLFWMEMMEEGFWISKRGGVHLILGTPWGELERFVGCVESFLKRHGGLVKI